MLLNQIVQARLGNIKSSLTTMLQNQVSQLKLKFNEAQQNINNQIEKLDLLNPIKPLEKGFAILKHNNKIVRSVTELNANSKLTAQLHDGVIDLDVVNIRKEKTNE
ncbi:exodeoxyribonuclease VII large subunit [Spiroplasma clarkii]|uniref:exodeoxyribonuclease VII large subunit n=1 Tax=Spiroplasma clarkii TaxID=2139 RepID=UPI0011BAD240|nr:exodeoxyribonuclease VII large subunit [Spiroplasma clarkii]